MQRAAQDSQANFEMSLRDQLIAAQNNSQPSEPVSQQASAPVAPSYTPINQPDHNDHSIDPSMGAPNGQDYAMGGMNIDDAIAAMTEGRQVNRRELSSSKRAAQNRAAQRAFRQRKEAYIGKLEKQVKDYRVMEEDFKVLQQENYQLREYILSLQSRILETSNELPPPPAQVNLHEPGSQPQQEPQSAPAVQHQQQQHPTAHPENHMPTRTPTPDQGQQLQAPREHQSPQEVSSTEVKFDAEPESQDQDRVQAAVANMSKALKDESMSQTAVEQLQAAAAEVGELRGDSASRVEG